MSSEDDLVPELQAWSWKIKNRAEIGNNSLPFWKHLRAENLPLPSPHL